MCAKMPSAWIVLFLAGLPAILTAAPATRPIPPAVAGFDYQYVLPLTGGAAPFRYQLRRGTLPPNLNFNHKSGVISGKTDRVGQYEVELEVASAEETLELRLLLEVLPPPAPTLKIPPSQLSAAHHGVPYAAQLSAQGGYPPYTWEVTGLPDWCRVSGGQFSGTPPLTATEAALIMVKVVDSRGYQTAERLVLKVESLPLQLVVPASVIAWFDRDVTTRVSATGGVLPYRFSCDEAQIYVDEAGVVTIPADTRLASALIGVTDARGSRARGKLEIKMAAPPPLVLRAPPRIVVRAGSKAEWRMSAIGGVPPYRYECLNRPVHVDPDGLASLLVAKSGNLAVRATDARGTTADADVTLDLIEPGIERASTAPEPAVAPAMAPAASEAQVDLSWWIQIAATGVAGIVVGLLMMFLIMARNRTADSRI